MARQKKPVLSYDDTSVETIAQTDPKAVEEYLRRLTFNVARAKNRHRQIYDFVRSTMGKALTDRQQSDPLFGALIERISRMTVILDRFEKELWDDLPKMTQEEVIGRLGGDYLRYLKEYREFIETFSHLRWVEDDSKKSRSIEKMRETVREQVVENEQG